jgi:hypothetical protein
MLNDEVEESEGQRVWITCITKELNPEGRFE